jgi:tetratricopeptide (TPR) repeat protein
MPVEWYCKRTWSPANREDFFRRLERSRTAYHKAQYLVIQAETLLKTKKREAYLVALELLEMALTKWPRDVQTVRAQFAIAECYVGLADLPRAVDAYHQVIRTQRRCPSWLTQGPMEFAWLVATIPMPKLYKEALAAMDEFPNDTFPEERYLTNASRALILTACGRKAQAGDFAGSALNESKTTRSGFGKSPRFWGKPTYEQLQKTLKKLAAGQTRKSKPRSRPVRKIKLQDKALRELAQMFASPKLVADDPTPGSELLNASRLDFTVRSLGLVDDYLAQMRKRKLDEDGEEYSRLVLRCGAYIGEVILRNARGTTFHWLDYKGALKINKDIADFGECLGSAATLWDSDTGLWFPLSKVQKFLDNGREDSVRFFADVVIEKSK